MRILCSPLLLASYLLAIALAPTVGGAQAPVGTPLHTQIDAAVDARLGGAAVGRAGDAEFLRRVSLDLSGALPSSAEARRFIADADPAKRAKLIDRLLASEAYADRMEQLFTVTWLERQPGTQVPEAEWRQFLRSSFAANAPWDQVVREVLRADDSDPRSAGAARFLLDSGSADPHRMSQNVGRLFLGMNLTCAQCHDHPTVPTWKQADYYGLYSYLRASVKQPIAGSSQARLVENVIRDKSEFESVFMPGEKHAIGPRLPGMPEVEVPAFEKGQEYVEPPAAGKPGVPKYRPRLLLASQLPSATNLRFARTSVNRFWFMLMGRGLVHPLDMDHPGNAPSHPELLDTLTRDFAAKGFNVKRLLREIALSEAYQRSSTAPAGVDPKTVTAASYRMANVKPLSAEQLSRCVPEALGVLPQLQRSDPGQRAAFVLKDYISGKVTGSPCTAKETQELFAGIFGNPPGEPEVEFQPSMSHSLFLLNDRLILGWLKPGEGNLVARLEKLNDPKLLAEELYVSVLTRQPDADEMAEVREHLGSMPASARTRAIADLVWALIASAEFRLNH